ncbi:paraquat-inducible protein A [Pollutimonas sp. M17]|uniref:paraquat-inducible protein A n=1 Tax=Pollutimonas sp. M17 TaxID=2962065 RepID=UPI0021F4CCA0|nr:paraquat-inducible protein A [Pollutimonas sp. M17]UYO93113.1 paraquat-inducible protein A [Pollutimonas sp. M17]
MSADGWLALTIAAGVMFLIANSYPVLQINLQGIHNETTLWQAASALAQGLTVPLAVPAALFIILVPFLQISLLGWVLAYSRVGRRAPGFVYVMRILGILRPWSMVEVGLLGILIAAIKLSKLADIVLGAGIWAMAASMILITIVSKRDLSSLWDIDEYSRQRTTARV